MKPVTLTLLLSLLTATAEPQETAEQQGRIGQEIAPFELLDYQGAQTALDDFSESKLVVVLFLGTECPLAKLYGSTLVTLYEQYAPRGVSFVGIMSNRQDVVEEIKGYAELHKIPFPLLQDPGNVVADAFSAERTPEAFVLDELRTVRYWGRIDDRMGVGYIRQSPNRRDLAEALEDLLADDPVRVPLTESVGCHIGRVSTGEPVSGGEVTYSNQIARILQSRCIECHRQGDVAPFPLTSYEEVEGWEEMIREVLQQRRMPPWNARSEHLEFDSAFAISDEERQLIFQWIDRGMPRGDTSDLPEPREFTKGWQLPVVPDLVIPMADKPFQVPADIVLEYQYFFVDPGFKEDHWIRAAEVVPGNKSVVHHAVVTHVSRKQKARWDEYMAARERGEEVVPPSFRGKSVGGYLPGKRVRLLDEGLARRVPANALLMFEVHYTPIGSPQEDITKVGLVFADKKRVTQEVQMFPIFPPDWRKFRIPANTEDHKITVEHTFRTDVDLISMVPHMHLRGKAMQYTAHFPDGRSELLLDVPDYDFNWQWEYRLTEPIRLPAGTTVKADAHYDNSAGNPTNPDPSVNVKWGEQTDEEMLLALITVAHPKKSDFGYLVADLRSKWLRGWKRKAAAGTGLLFVLTLVSGGLCWRWRRQPAKGEPLASTVSPSGA